MVDLEVTREMEAIRDLVKNGDISFIIISFHTYILKLTVDK